MSFYQRYFGFLVVSFLTSLLGSTCVHYYYQPLQDFDDLVDLEFEELMDLEREKQK